MAPKSIVTKYRGRCRSCFGQIEQGANAVWLGHKQTYHPDCAPTESNPTQPQAPAPGMEPEPMSNPKQVVITVDTYPQGTNQARCGHDHPDHLSALPCTKLAKRHAAEWFPHADVTVKQWSVSEAAVLKTTMEAWNYEIPWESKAEESKPASPTPSEPKRTKSKSKPDAAHLLGQLQELLSGGGVDEDSIRELIDQRLDERLADIDRPVTKRIEFPEATIEPEEGEIQHPQYERLARYIAGGVTRIWITGEAGTGKTHAVEQIARGLDRTLFTITPVVDKYELFGYCDAHGNYVATQLYEWATSEDPHAILLLDEIDGFQPAALVAANAALANGAAVFPKHGRVEITPTKTVIATANTTGEGPTLKYNARMAQDGALMDRFEQFVHWGVHEATERAIARAKAPYDTTDGAVDMSVKIRHNLDKHGIDLSWGPRRTYALAKAMACGDSVKDAALGAGLMKLDEHGRNRALEGVQ